MQQEKFLQPKYKNISSEKRVPGPVNQYFTDAVLKNIYFALF